MSTILTVNDPGSHERTRRVLEWCLSHADEWANDHMSYWLVDGVIESLQDYPDLITSQLVSTLLDTRTAGLLRELSETLKRLRDPNLVPLLESQLNVTWPDGQEVGVWSANILA
ncbi:MAG: hypothetical protein ACI8QS_001868 [Planctomycetota bacterium]|jgi:hypothetical protein